MISENNNDPNNNFSNITYKKLHYNYMYVQIPVNVFGFTLNPHQTNLKFFITAKIDYVIDLITY